MRTLASTLFVLTAWTALFGQDGSDIFYAKIDELDKTYLGVFVHLDFYRRSFRGRDADTISIDIDNKKVRFVEHREDTGYNNWFHEQYLQSLDKVDSVTVRIVKSRVDALTTDSIFVTNFLAYYSGDKLLRERSKEKTSAFSKAIINEVLVSGVSYKQHNSR